MGRHLMVIAAIVCAWPGGVSVERRPAPLVAWLDAHNCYPENGRGVDRLARALAAARGVPAIEQDVAWDAKRRQSVVSHDTDLDGTEPTLDEHFFQAVATRMEHALATGDPATWPVLVLHLDFKTNEPEHHAAVWKLLGRYRPWLMTARRVDSSAGVQPFVPGPLLVLTEDGDGQERAFHDAVPVGGELRLFGTVPRTPEPAFETAAARFAAAVSAPPETLIASGATNYRRWTNHSWAVVEEGGQAGAGAWTVADRERLEALVTRAHDLGLWIRFYTLNGHGPTADGWTGGYNFGSLEAVTPRWRAAVSAAVDFIATDQCEGSTQARLALEWM